MPSEISQQIVKQIFADDNASALNSVRDALNSIAYDEINTRKGELAQTMGFDYEDDEDDQESPDYEDQLEVETDEDDETDS